MPNQCVPNYNIVLQNPKIPVPVGTGYSPLLRVVLIFIDHQDLLDIPKELFCVVELRIRQYFCLNSSDLGLNGR